MHCLYVFFFVMHIAAIFPCSASRLFLSPGLSLCLHVLRIVPLIPIPSSARTKKPTHPPTL